MIFSGGCWGVSGKIFTWLLAPFLVIILLVTSAQAQAQAQAQDSFSPLSQGDIDSYVYFLPRLQGEVAKNPLEASAILGVAGVTRERAVFITTKIAIALAISSRLLSPSQLDDGKIPYYFKPSAEELNLVQKNIVSLKQAQHLAKQNKPVFP